MSDTPISDSTPHNVADLGMLCRRIERELNAANERIKRLEEAGDVMDPMNDSECECDYGYVVVCKHCFDRSEKWRKAKEAKL